MGLFGVPWWVSIGATLLLSRDDEPEKLKTIREPVDPVPSKLRPTGPRHRTFHIGEGELGTLEVDVDPLAEVGVSILYSPRLVPKQAGRDVWGCWLGGFANECASDLDQDVVPLYGLEVAMPNMMMAFVPNLEISAGHVTIMAWPKPFLISQASIRVDVFERI